MLKNNRVSHYQSSQVGQQEGTVQAKVAFDESQRRLRYTSFTFGVSDSEENAHAKPQRALIRRKVDSDGNNLLD